MIREIDVNQIRPEKLMSASDMARLGCNDCAGCSDCCRNRGTAILLDAWDVAQMKENLGMTFEELLDADFLDLTLADGILLPSLGSKKDRDECLFLREDGRCGIHAFRPGICRMYPLARIYHEDGSFSYFLQEGECGRGSRAKIRISKWLGIADLKGYEQEVRAYHDRLVQLREACARVETNAERAALQRAFLMECFGEEGYRSESDQ